jgi:hypothetical protein
MRWSLPTALATSSTSAPVASHSADTELMEEMRCARNALATSLDSSDDHRLVVMMRSRGTHWLYTAASVATARWPSGDWSPPMSTRDGDSRSRTAVPSARNSGLDTIWNDAPPRCECSTRRSVSAVFTGTVDFSTMIRLPLVHTRPIMRAASSMFFTSDA